MMSNGISMGSEVFDTLLPRSFAIYHMSHFLFTQTEKIPISKVPTLNKTAEVNVSPSTSIVSLEDEVIALRARNKAMTKALQVIKETATKEKKRHHDLVWYARNRSRFPNSDARKRIETDMEHSEELEKLTTPEADYFHGIHSGILAAARVFEKQADILHVNEKDDATEVMSEAVKHEKKIKESLQTIYDYISIFAWSLTPQEKGYLLPRYF